MADAPAGGADPRPPRDPAAGSRDLAADLWLRPRRARRSAPIAAGAIAAAAVVLAVVIWALAPRSAPVTPPGDEAGRALEPIRPRADLQTGEQVAPFQGFAVSVDTEPSGALVSVDGVPRGEAPVLAGVDCAPGDRVEIAAEKKGFPVARVHTSCRRDALVKLSVRLRR